MPGLTGLIEALGSVGATVRSLAADLDVATEARRSYNEELRDTERLESTSAMTKAEGGAVNTKALAQAMNSKRGR